MEVVNFARRGSGRPSSTQRIIGLPVDRLTFFPALLTFQKVEKCMKTLLLSDFTLNPQDRERAIHGYALLHRELVEILNLHDAHSLGT